MFVACEKGKLDIVNYLVALSVDVNFPDSDGQTALFFGDFTA